MNGATRSYLDYNATAPVRPVVAQAVARALMVPGNPSSIHAEGRAARIMLDTARDSVAALVGTRPAQVTFTSGGTEAANTVLSGALRRVGQPAPTRLLISATEHSCVATGHRFTDEAVEVLPVDPSGILRLDVLRERLTALAGESLLISVHAANNETGAVQPLAEIIALAREHGRALVHSDAVQAIGKIHLDMAALGLDALTLSGHKFAAPKGVGALAVGRGVTLEGAFIRGGGQESRLRCGTENLSGIVGMGEAARHALTDLDAEGTRLAGFRDTLEARVLALAPDAVIFGKSAPRLPNTLSFAVPGLDAATTLIAFDLAGVAVSSGSACSSGKVARSATLAAMGVSPALAAGALRVSFGWNSRDEDMTRFLMAFERAVQSLYQRRGQAA
ncbi:cysteine desulfurase family protein [Methylobacterium gnaphalii]|uniref:Cysteine desulfurase n=1 Tax=Methylobacterium gnaphalii TaxID=1010610 RepID=A0A512JMZ0_9HYPH|nr:cysteine desulfurase family protein [Methylobacterium gnaphalii]GEP11340.1 cysteine desulfurase [Methylobacterium gnaphalii]GJD67189.1 Cysteine desulfurase NifS [Methylobacterium gnaphalii]GLS50040.1 cysteine desulfurase [Methylobacterium gnaphalii]